MTRRACLAAFGLALLAWAMPAGAQSLEARDWKAIQDVIADQHAALVVGDAEKAFGYAAHGIRGTFGTPARFMAMVRASYAVLLDARYTAFLEGAVIEGRIVQPLRLVMPDDTVYVALYEVQRQPDGAWRIAGCAIAPSTVRSA